MWSGGNDLNDEGKPVRVYQPILFGRKPRVADLTCSFVGGPALATATGCPTCHDFLYPLVQLHTAATKVTLQVFACNRASCIRGLFPAAAELGEGRNVLCYGGGDGVVICRRQTATEATRSADSTTAPRNEPQPTAPCNNEWEMDGGGEEATSCNELDDLESKLAMLETKRGPEKSSRVGHTTKVAISMTTPTTLAGFPSFELHSLQEPLSARLGRGEYRDDDDVGMGNGRGSDDRKIQQMLAQYIAVEEDEDIVAILCGNGGSSSARGGSAKHSERDERLSAADRALFTFSDRIKRVPRQVLRHAHGGSPLWSMYVHAMR